MDRALFEKELQMWLRSAKKVVVAGIGNSLRKDDYVGVRVVEELRDKISKSVFLIECESVPENYVDKIVEFKPTHVLLIDAALLDAEPGAFKLVDVEQIATWPPVSTHALPLRIFCDYVAETTGAEIALIGIQPENADFGEGMTERLESTAKVLAELLIKALP